MEQNPSKQTIALVEKALSRLDLSWGWSDAEEIHLLDASRVTQDEALPVTIVVRDDVIQMSTPIPGDELHGEQLSVIIWQEWRRRGDAAFCLLPEEEGDPIQISVRLPLPDIDPKELSPFLQKSLEALSRSREKIRDLLADIDLYVKNDSTSSAGNKIEG